MTFEIELMILGLFAVTYIFARVSPDPALKPRKYGDGRVRAWPRARRVGRDSLASCDRGGVVESVARRMRAAKMRTLSIRLREDGALDTTHWEWRD